MSDEKILFEMRVFAGEHGPRIEVTESEEWKAYHAPNAPFAQFADWVQHARQNLRRNRKESLRRNLDALQGIYDDVYGRNQADVEV